MIRIPDAARRTLICSLLWLAAGCHDGLIYRDRRPATTDQCPLEIAIPAHVRNAGLVLVRYGPENLETIEVEEPNAVQIIAATVETQFPRRGSMDAVPGAEHVLFPLSSRLPTDAGDGVRVSRGSGVYEVAPGTYQLVLKYRGHAGFGRTCFAASDLFTLSEKSISVGE